MPAASPSDGLDVVVRPARDSDAEGLIELIGGCFAEYPDCVMDVDGEIPELRAIATYASQRNGAFWTVDQGEEVIGCIGAVPLDDGGIELIKLYVRADARGQGLGRRLISQVE
ncbi:MAG: GNAT family N-acetyltransferase, partial [Pseudomonadota bacterium]